MRAVIESGAGHFAPRMTKYPEAFRRITGESLFPGTVNLRVSEPIPPREHFRLRGIEIDEPGQDLLFEVVRVNGFWVTAFAHTI